ncbi:hypothetical protein BACSTE_02406 [Bacteroides stercoris ATCC 43183]|uniref:Uncharacterized protein n=1 Tax=Bacteroides stercoris ATCC 43183 TaxID=449673 RepID=B0NSE3_BACSE|nr:hypothetical protein BACSTE_02406 [Bacteroides stercoris ATCC 43183]
MDKVLRYHASMFLLESKNTKRRCVVMHDAPLFCSSLYKSVHFL